MLMKTPREPQRLAKVLAERGIASRGEADRMIERGWVRVDGRVAVPGQRAAPDVEITLSPEAEARLHAAVTVLLNKPSGFVSAPDETGGARAQSLLVHANYDGRGVAPEWSALGLRVAGRLAVQDAGLVIYTTDTALARRLALPEVDESWRFRFLHGRRPDDAAARLMAALADAGRRGDAAPGADADLVVRLATPGKGELAALSASLGWHGSWLRERRGEIALPRTLASGRWCLYAAAATSGEPNTAR